MTIFPAAIGSLPKKVSEFEEALRSASNHQPIAHSGYPPHRIRRCDCLLRAAVEMSQYDKG